MLQRITDKQRIALQTALGNPYGSLRVLAKELGIAHISFYDHIKALIRKGYLQKVEGKWKMTKEGSGQLLMDLATNRFKKSK